MNVPSFGRRHAVAASLAAACALAVASPAGAQAPQSAAVPPGAFLTGDELPEHPSGWWAFGVEAGLPENPVSCFEDELPAEGASHQRYRTDLDTEALQVVVEAEDEASAAALADALEEAAAACAADWLRENPGSTAAWDDYGTVEGADGGHVFGVYVAPPQAGMSVSLFGVGRDGTRVTLVDWGQMGTLQDAPVEEFAGTLGSALGRLGS
ncbi:hypothetical protein [Streptomyces marincola]|uniref:Uncharacterized protein n=1 Tax=Streptomyces marincola TaxID=2878388 RepID=A0A1W7D363_9ACTN|nr:hypothetical protein [Streptomyces marincola]ARQ71501.1 hypothetical protein CAG99_24100 [Streptomyces marincola]